jgi:hypothetical protein
MNELGRIVRAAETEIESGQTALMATLVKAYGSTYRRPGARMLLTGDGWVDGSLSGGCLEGDVIRKAWWRTENGPSVVTYDSMNADASNSDESDDEIAWGLGCNGIVEALLERLTPETRWHLTILSQWLTERSVGVVATIIRRESDSGSQSVRIGQRLTLSASGEVQTDIPDPLLCQILRESAETALRESRSLWRTFPVAEGGTAEAFFEFVAPPLSLLLFGAGHDAVPLTRLAKLHLGWRVTVVDTRAARPRPERFPDADSVITCAATDTASLQALLATESPDAVVLMTHNYHDDAALIRPVLSTDTGYIGILGPRSRAERLLQESLGASLTDFPERIYAPVGLDIGADNPEAIALAIVAEIQASSAGRQGGMLRARQGPIHAREAERKDPTPPGQSIRSKTEI